MVQASSLQEGNECGRDTVEPRSELDIAAKLDISKVAAESEPQLTRGSCVLQQAAIAKIVQRALLHFHGQRYILLAWCIMPNHVHLVLAPLEEHTLSRILHSIKSYTANRINNILGRRGPLWERESFDHLIRTPEHLQAFCEYVEQNPVKAGLCENPENWPFSSCGAGFQPDHSRLGLWTDPLSTPIVEMRSRGELPHLHKPPGIYFVTDRLLDAVGNPEK